MLGVGEYVWRLIPANPILLRVVETGGKRRRDLIVRCGYLGLLVFLVIFRLMASAGSIGGAQMGDLSKVSRQIFESMSYLQLALVALLAPIFTAGAITQERDSQTYDILLATPLTNGQIVFGSLFSRLFFVIALLISGIPIFSITQIFGGVAISSIVMSFLIAAATAFVTGALAMAIAVFKVGTRRTIFSFYLFVVLYLVGVALLDQVPYFHVLDVNGDHVKTSWFTAMHPFLALRSIFNNPDYIPPDVLALPESLRGRFLGWYWSNPASFYVTFMFVLSFVLIAPSIVLLRRLAQSTVSLKDWALQKLHISKGDQTRKPRFVWHNPIAWREAKTKASAARTSIMRYGFIAAGVIGAIVMVAMFSITEKPTYYVLGNSYDSTAQTLTVYSANESTTYKLPSNTPIRLNKNEANVDILRGMLAVEVTTTPNKQSLTSVNAFSLERRLEENEVRKFLLGAVIVEFAVILLIVTNAAASTVTREKEDGSLDLLLSTPITSRYYIWGKLRGLVSFVLPLVAVPVVSVLIFVIYDLVRLTGSPVDFRWIVFPEAVLIMPGLLIIVAAFAAILGMNMSLRCRTTVRAVMSSVGIVVGICAGLGWCGYQMLRPTNMANELVLMFASFSPFTVITVLIDPYTLGGRIFDEPTRIPAARFIILFVSWVATAAYAVVVWSMYKTMVKNFDMTIRRQSR